MNQLKRHPLEMEADRVVMDLGGDLSTMKYVTDTGTSYSFVFNTKNDGGMAAYLALPVYVPSRSDNLFRIEFIVSEVKAEDVGCILFAITLDMDLQRYTPLRVVPRTKNNQTYEIILQTVCNVDAVREGFIAAAVICGLELAELYRMDLLRTEAAAS